MDFLRQAAGTSWHSSHFRIATDHEFLASLDAHPEFDLSWGRFWLTPQAQFPKTLPTDRVFKREACMKRVTRRQFVRRTTAGLAGILAYQVPPAFSRRRERTGLSGMP